MPDSVFEPRTEAQPSLQDLLGHHPSSKVISSFLERLAGIVPSLNATVAIDTLVIPTVKSYPDAVYFNYPGLGLSLLFAPQDGYRPSVGLLRSQLREEALLLESVDVYNVTESTLSVSQENQEGKKGLSRLTELAFRRYPEIPVVLKLSSRSASLPASSSQSENASSALTSPHPTLSFYSTTDALTLVTLLGEPSRKGGGGGPAHGSLGIWCEWAAHGLMVEFGGPGARGPGAWEKDTGGKAVWRVATIWQAREVGGKR